MQSKYDKSRHVLIEQSQMEEPDKEMMQEAGLDDEIINEFISDYNAHVASLRTIPCHESFKGEDGKIYEEGKDFEVVFEETDSGGHWSVKSLEIYAAPIPKEDDLWNAAIEIYEDMRPLGKLHRSNMIKELSKHYTITKKTATSE